MLFIRPSVITYLRIGINPFRFKKGDTAISFVGKVYKLISVLAFITVLINAFFPKAMKYLIPIESLHSENLPWIGLALIYLSSIWVFIAQHNMGNEWRIGIDSINKVNLVTKGLFSVSRNPIFLGVILTFMGLFLMIPNIITVIILIIGIIVIQIQVRLEEEFLFDELGELYLNYKKKTKRWL